MFKGLIGDRAFYKKTLLIAVPIIIQNAVTNLVNLLDNLMVGTLGTEAMSGVAIVNQFIFVFNLAVFGVLSAAGIFAAQYCGNGDTDGIRYAMRAKLILCSVVGALGIAVFLLFGENLVSGFLHEGTEGDLALTLGYAKEYIVFLVIGLLPHAIAQAYASTLRETGETFVPMISSIVSVVTNFLLNGLLIFGLLGFPALGVVGAAIATSVSRFAELLVLVLWTHTHEGKCPYAVGVYKSFYIPLSFIRKIALKGVPILFNEILWALSGTMRNQCYSTRGLDVVAALNIAMTLYNLLSVAYMSLSNSVAIIIGNLLGAGKFDEARDTDKKLLFFSFASGVIMMLLQMLLAPIFPYLYNTSDGVRDMATFILVAYAISMPASALAMSTYYTIRSGGRVFITMMFDSGYAWIVMMPAVAILSHFTTISIYWLIPIILVVENLKLFAGLVLVKRGIWVRRLTDR